MPGYWRILARLSKDNLEVEAIDNFDFNRQSSFPKTLLDLNLILLT